LTNTATIPFAPIALPDLSTPPTIPGNALRVIALGGLGDVGRNMTVLETQGRLLVIDCGVLPRDVGNVKFSE
jgi:mRNA degradation ribonuclease J1/J2